MGNYVNRLGNGAYLGDRGKVEGLMSDGAYIVPSTAYQENMVCVLDNILFEAAYIVPENELEMLRRDKRYKTWLVYPNLKNAE